MIKVVTVVGTRPEIIKMSRLISEFNKEFNHILVHSGQNYDYQLNEIFFKELGLNKPKYYLNSKSSSPIKTISKILSRTEEVLLKEKPDAFVVYGDTNSCLSAYVAKRLKIPVFHFEAGNRCFDDNVPEEVNRRIIDHISDVNFVISNHARNYLIREGIKQNLIVRTGSHLKEVIMHYKEKIEKSKILRKLNLTKSDYILISLHREENVDNKKNLENIFLALKMIKKKYKKNLIFTLHPRSKKKLKEFNIKSNFLYFKPFGYFDYLNLQQNSFCTISDSGTISEEAYLLNFPAVSLRNNNERPEAIDSGVHIISGLQPEMICSALEYANVNRIEYLKKNLIAEYEFENVSSVAVKAIYSFVNYIDRVIWHKN